MRKTSIFIIGLIVLTAGALYVSRLAPNADTPSNVTTEKEWASYQSPLYSFSFRYPSSQEYKIIEDGGMGFTPGQFGSSLYDEKSKDTVFNVEVFHTPEWDTLGNVYGDVDALKDAFKSGGVEAVATLSRQVNVQNNGSPKKTVSDLKTYDFKEGTGYGFTASESFSWCFKLGQECKSGYVLNRPRTIVFVSDGQNIYKIEFSEDLGEQIFPTFQLK